MVVEGALYSRAARSSGAGRFFLSTLPLLVSGSLVISTIAEGTMYSGKRPFSVLAAPLPPKRVEMVGLEAAAVALFVTDPELKPRTQAATLRAMFGLTRAEAQLLLLLLEGISVKEAAQRLELGPETVRTQLKSIFQKTDTHRQADLIRHVLLSTLPRIEHL